jgi:hypothetical protein
MLKVIEYFGKHYNCNPQNEYVMGGYVYKASGEWRDGFDGADAPPISCQLPVTGGM